MILELSHDPIVQNVIRATAGLPAGMRTVEYVQTVYGIDVRLYPNLFQIHGDLVSRTTENERIYQAYLAEVRHNKTILGIK